MGYHRSFGMRSFENIVRVARFRTPANVTFVIGEPVMLDSANPGRLKAATAGVAPGANTGIVVFEHIQMQGIDAMLNTNSDLATVPAGRYAQMVHGPGTKVWFKNAADKTLYDGRTQDNPALLASSINLNTLAPGDGLTPDGSSKFKKSSGGDGVWLIVEQVNPSTGVVEARFTF